MAKPTVEYIADGGGDENLLPKVSCAILEVDIALLNEARVCFRIE